MDFQLSDEQKELRDSVRRYTRERLLPLAEEIEQTGQPPSRELIREFSEMGYLGINVPEALGGQGLGNLEALLVIEELGRASSAVAFPESVELSEDLSHELLGVAGEVRGADG